MEMGLSLPQLYIFPISHYCEKARWALDYLDVPYDLTCLAPGLHGDLAAKLGAPDTSLPILVAKEGTIQGSDKIIEWAQNCSRNGQSLDPEDLSTAVAMEQRLNDVLGVHVRRMYYSEALIEHPQTVLPIFSNYLADQDAQFVRDAWEFITAAMVEKMDLGADQEQASRQVVLEQLDWLDALLADGRNYLGGERFSRLDISAAALLAPLAEVSEHPTYGGLQMPPRLSQDVAAWQHRPVTKYVASMYRQHRSA